MSTPTTKDPILQRHTQIVRTIEANLKIRVDNAREAAFRTALLAEATTALPAMNQTLITRLYEASCGVEFPAQDIAEFRIHLQRQIAKNLGIKAPPKTPASPAK